MENEMQLNAEDIIEYLTQRVAQLESDKAYQYAQIKALMKERDEKPSDE